jgi:hypothetical protein
VRARSDSVVARVSLDDECGVLDDSAYVAALGMTTHCSGESATLNRKCNILGAWPGMSVSRMCRLDPFVLPATSPHPRGSRGTRRWESSSRCGSRAPAATRTARRIREKMRARGAVGRSNSSLHRPHSVCRHARHARRPDWLEICASCGCSFRVTNRPWAHSALLRSSYGTEVVAREPAITVGSVGAHESLATAPWPVVRHACRPVAVDFHG